MWNKYEYVFRQVSKNYCDKQNPSNIFLDQPHLNITQQAQDRRPNKQKREREVGKNSDTQSFRSSNCDMMTGRANSRILTVLE